MFIDVRTSNPGHAGTFTPGRFWPNGVRRRLEVVEDDVAVKQITVTKQLKEDPAVFRLKVAEGPYLPDGTPDPNRITRAGLAAIRGNQHLSIDSDEETQGTLSHAAVNAARAEAQKANSELTDAKIYAAAQDEEIAKLQKANSELTDRVTVLEKELDEATKPKPKTKDPKDAPTTEPAK